VSPTLRDVATLANVSYGTVARVVHQRGDVAEETRQRVQAAIAQLDYRPNVIARSLRKRKSYTIGIAVSNILNPRFAGGVRGVQDVVEEEGYQTVLGNTDENPEKEARFLEMLLGQRVDGLVVLPAGGVNRAQVARFQSSGIPVVLLNRRLEGVDAVLSDNPGGIRLALQHLLGLGHRRIGMIVAPISSTTSGRERVATYNDLLRAAGEEPDPSLTVEGGFDPEGGYRAALRLLSSADRPTAVLATAVFLTLGTLRAIQELRLRVPEDVSLIGFNETQWAPYLSPALTVVADDSREMGRQAAKILFQRIRGELSPERVELRVPVTLTVRCSCAPAAAIPRTGALPR